MTIFSPCRVGSEDTRKSIDLFFDRTSFMRPSCGTRFSEMSRREMTLMRAAIFSFRINGGWAISRRMPSVRTRMR